MSPEVQQITALVLVVLAAVSIVWRAWRARTSGNSGGSCPGCGQCGRPRVTGARSAPQATPLVTLGGGAEQRLPRFKPPSPPTAE